MPNDDQIGRIFAVESPTHALMGLGYSRVGSSGDNPAQYLGAESSVYYRNCAAARRAGAAPINAGEPGYRNELDRDGDGLAREPYRGR